MTVTDVVGLSGDVELASLLRRVTDLGASRRLIGLAGEPGAGKSTLATALHSVAGEGAVVVPLDGFHLADVELARQGLLGRKGAPETFDGWGYAALLDRLRRRPRHPVYAPAFERDLEQPLAGAICVAPEVDLVLTEGNYLLLDSPAWVAARERLDEVWYVRTDPLLRQQRLVERHVAFGKGAVAAADWVARVDEPNARLVQRFAERADLVVDLSGWSRH